MTVAARAEARRLLRSAQNAFYSGHLNRSPELVAKTVADILAGIRLLHEAPARRSGLIDTATAYQLLGEIYLQVGQSDDAIDAFAEADATFQDAGGDSEEYGRFLHDFSVTLQNLGAVDYATTCAQKALKILSRYGRSYEHELTEWLAILSGDGLEILRRRAARAFPGHRRARARQMLASALCQRDDAATYAAEIFTAMKYAFRVFKRRKELDEIAAVIGLALNLYWLSIQLPDWLGPASQSVHDLAARRRRLDLMCTSLTLRAAWLEQRHQTNDALSQALRAAALHDEHLLTTETSEMRMLTGRVGQFAREIALHLAISIEDAMLAAELVETTRLQVEPDTDPDRPEGRSPILGLRTVSVGGRSRLVEHYTAGRTLEVLALEDSIAAVGGPSAYWWATWLVNGKAYWVLSIEGGWSCGQIDISVGGPHHNLVMRALGASLHNTDATVQEIIRGEWCRNVISEELLSADLGAILIPPALSRVLLDRGDSRPASLVVAGNLLNQIPLPMLGMRRDPMSQLVRLVEVAVIRVAPPSILVDMIVRRPLLKSALHEIQVACVNPTNNLANSGLVSDFALVTLSGDPRSGRQPSTLSNLSTALGLRREGDSGIFYYSGHTVANGLGGDDEDGLALTNGDVLSARLLFGSAGHRFPFPARCMISACKSGGTAGGGGGEWLGLSAALLTRGSRQVVGTNWSIWDTQFTSAFDIDLSERLRQTDDVAGALREAQVAALRSWRTSSHDFSNHRRGGLPGRAARLAFPVIWASYCCIGVRD
jgi:tetratricopeptide (TPR) repeat protein